MTEEQKLYIENNINLIERNRLEEFFTSSCPRGIGTILMDAGIDFLSYLHYIPAFCFEDSIISEFVIPNHIKKIGKGAFVSCESLKNVIIPYGVEIIDSFAFNACTKLSEIIIPASVTTIGDSAFVDSGIKSVTLSESWANVGRAIFENCDKLTNVTISEGVTKISSSMFAGCVSLRRLSIPNSVTSIEDRAFCCCKGLANITIPDSVTSIGEDVFVGCAFTSISIPDGITTIPRRTFAHCKALKSVTIPDSVTTIGSYAFEECGELTNVVYQGTAEQWRNIDQGSLLDPFYNCFKFYHIVCSDSVILSSWGEWISEDDD